MQRMMFILSFIGNASIMAHSISLDHISADRIKTYQATVARQVKEYRTMSFALQGAMVIPLIYMVSSMFQEKTVSAKQLSELVKKCSCIEGHFASKKIAYPVLNKQTTLYDWGFFAAKQLTNSCIYMLGIAVQQGIAIRVLEALNKKIDVFLNYPGSLEWFVKHKTRFTDLLKQYEEKLSLLSFSDKNLNGELDRAKEFISSQWHYFVADLEKIGGYMQYCQDAYSLDEDELLTIITHVVSCVDELSDKLSCALSSNEWKKVYCEIQKFKIEINSLLKRFARLSEIID